MIGRDGKTKKRLEQPMEMCRLEQIDSADNVGDSLESVIDDDGKVIAGADVFANEDDVTEPFRPGFLGAEPGVRPEEAVSGEGTSFFLIEAECAGDASGKPGGALVFGKAAAGAGVGEILAAVGGLTGPFDLAADVCSGAEARIEQSAFREPSGGGAIVLAVFALETDRPFPFDPQPGEIFEDPEGVFARASGRVDVLDAEEKVSALSACQGIGRESGKRVPLVKQASRAGGKSGRHETSGRRVVEG